MWALNIATQILSTIYERVRIKYHILKSPDGVALQVRNYGDTDYADIDVKGLRFSGAIATLTEYVAIPAYTATVVTGAALVVGVSTPQILNEIITQGAGANGDKRKYRLPLLSPGSYEFRHLYISQSASGIVDFAIEDVNGSNIVSITGIDHYTASSTFNQRASATFTLPAYDSDELYLTATINSKNGSSSGFAALMTQHELMMLDY